MQIIADLGEVDKEAGQKELRLGNNDTGGLPEVAARRLERKDINDTEEAQDAISTDVTAEVTTGAGAVLSPPAPPSHLSVLSSL